MIAYLSVDLRIIYASEGWSLCMRCEVRSEDERKCRLTR